MIVLNWLMHLYLCKCVALKGDNLNSELLDNDRRHVTFNKFEDVLTCQGQVCRYNASRHTDTPVESHEDHVTPSYAAGKLPGWDYSHHGADWTHGMCMIGKKQSPVDLHVEGLETQEPHNLKDIYDDVLGGKTPNHENVWKRGDFVYIYNHFISSLKVLRTPTTFRISVPRSDGPAFGTLFTTDSPNFYMATHIDFHSPSEHTFDGSANRRQLEMQIWHYLNDSDTTGYDDLQQNITHVNFTSSKHDETNRVVTVKAHKGSPDKSQNQKGDDEETLKPKGPESNSTDKSAHGDEHKSTEEAEPTPLNTKDELISHRDAVADGYVADYSNEEESTDEKLLDGYKSGLDDGESLLQLSSRSFEHPAAKISEQRPLLESENLDLFNKYLLSHLKHSANNNVAEKMHITKRDVARTRNINWGRWAVISLTFMTEEMEKTNIETLKAFPSERFMTEILKVGSSVGVLDDIVYPSVGDLNRHKSNGKLPVINTSVPLNISSLLMMLEVKNINYFTYDGSFTQPGCEETVKWFVAQGSLPISTELMLQLHRMLNPNTESKPQNSEDNYRELQNVNDKHKNLGKVRFVHGYPMEYFITSPFAHAHKSSFNLPGTIFAILLLVIAL